MNRKERRNIDTFVLMMWQMTEMSELSRETISPVRSLSKNVTSLLIIDPKKSFLKLYPMRSPIYPNITERMPTHNAETYERRK